MTLRLLNRPIAESLRSQNLVVIGQNLNSHFSDFPSISEHFEDDKNTSFKIKSEDGNLSKVHIFPISSDASRHNSSLRPDLISSALAGVLSEPISDIDILCCIPSASASLAAAVAVARALPCKYNRKTGAKISPRVNLSFITSDSSQVGDLDHTSLVASAVRDAQAWTDSAPNDFNTTEFVTEAQRIALEVGASVEVISGEDLRNRGFGGIWGVGKASDNPPALVHLSFNTQPGSHPRSSAVMVGKGITYDSGGLAIKSRDGMCGMKRDMGGAAAVLAAFGAIARSVRGGNASLRYERLDCILCIAENSVGSSSFRNDDILQMYSGLTVEINNTDAEGRLVLADGVAYSAKHIPNVELVIDMATLTGAATYSGGHIHGAMLSNDESVEREAIAAGKDTGDCVFPMLYMPEIHVKHFKSEVADMTNSVCVRDDCPSSCAGLFIEKNLIAAGYKGKWLHVDMAKPVLMKGGLRSSGYGVALLSKMMLL